MSNPGPPSARQLLAPYRHDAERRGEAEVLLAHVLGRDRAWLFAHATDALPVPVVEAFTTLMRRRDAGEPVAYLTGRRGFWTLELAVTSATLIPRPETELLVEQALARWPESTSAVVADLGTGSGAIALALAVEHPHARIFAVDASGEALNVARCNAERLGLANVQWLQGDWLQPLGEQCCDLLVSNPPYIEQADPHLEQGDLRHEPRQALASGPEGLDAIRRIVADAPSCLRAGGWLLLEHGAKQGAAVRALMQAGGYDEVFTVRDLEGRERVTGGRRLA